MQKTHGKDISKGLHPRNPHRQAYDFNQLAQCHGDLNQYLISNRYGGQSIDFADPAAVKALNCALLKHFYNIKFWDIPEGFLCPPIPGRVDYIHYVADLLSTGKNAHQASRAIKLIDIGCGANGIYSILASQIYGWHCLSSDINPLAIHNLAKIIEQNKSLHNKIELRLQKEKHHIFHGLIQGDETFDISVCNPPFHASLKEADKANQKKHNNLARSRGESVSKTPQLNFGGQHAELWCKGGESRFLRIMMKESRDFSEQCRWFTSLVSKKENLPPAHKLLKKLKVKHIKEIKMKQGNKITRILAWSFMEET